jgi:hypothetical protein
MKQTYLVWNASSSFKAKNFFFDNTLDYEKDARQQEIKNKAWHIRHQPC